MCKEGVVGIHQGNSLSFHFISCVFTSLVRSGIFTATRALFNLIKILLTNLLYSTLYEPLPIPIPLPFPLPLPAPQRAINQSINHFD